MVETNIVANNEPTVAVVGATSAVAQAAIRAWAQRKQALTLIARNAGELERIASDARVRGAPAVVTLVGDLTDTTFIAETARTMNLPRTALVAYGSLSDSTRADTDAAYLADELNTNFVSAALWTQALAERMAADSAAGGTIAVISSVAGDRGRGSNHAYGAAKAGLTAFCSGLRARMAARRVHVVTIKPGFIDSPMTAHITKKGALWATPEAVAAGIIRAIDKKRDVVYLPGFWQLIMLVIQHVPEKIFKRLKF
jgi:decaprenylphospho-beta-D-erythro-pentofuranosid-2-ulose 2-reductase